MSVHLVVVIMCIKSVQLFLSKREVRRFALKYSEGFILVELLLAVWIVGCILYLLLTLMSGLDEKINYERALNKQLQVNSLITEDVINGTEVIVADECLKIRISEDVVSYCFRNEQLVREVNGRGYERIIDNVTGKFYYSRAIFMLMEVDEQKTNIPVWTK